MQGAALRQEGRSPWQERERQFEELAQSGGLLVTTPETLGAILIGKPQFHREHLDVVSLLRAHHIVFDEAHTLTTRGFGFLHFWAVLIARRHLIYPEQTPKFTLLSTTHSNLLEGLVGGDKPYIPKERVACFDEKIKDERGDGLRLLHGDVTVEVADADILSLAERHAQEIINQEGRLLILYDSLRDLANEERALERIFNALGLKSKECFVITGQDKQSDGRALGGSDFEAGLRPETHHRIILATSSIEAGVNIKGLRYAILDPGMDAAALLQRIGRVARKDVDGRIWISQPKDTPYHLPQLVELCGEVSVQAVYDHLKPLRIIHLKAARELGSAYWSMLAREQLALMKSIRREAHPALSEAKPPGAFLDSLWLMTKQFQEKGVRWQE
jgi:Helicase conserved C-terminal domain